MIFNEINEWVLCSMAVRVYMTVLYVPKTHVHSRPSNWRRFRYVRASLAPATLEELHFHSLLVLSVERKWSNHYVNSHKLNFDKVLWFSIFRNIDSDVSYPNKRSEKQNTRLITWFQIQVLILSHFPFCSSSPASLSLFHWEAQQTSVKVLNTWPSNTLLSSVWDHVMEWTF